MRSKRGFTLIEVLVAVVMFALGILALNRVQMATINANSYANQLSTATELAQQHMENLLSHSLSFTLSGDSYNNCWVDTTGDGTGKDTNTNGIDDRDESNSAGNMEFGLNKTGSGTADHTLTPSPTGTDGTTYNIYWNIAVGFPVAGMNTARTIVQWTDRKNVQHTVSFDCTKSSSY